MAQATLLSTIAELDKAFEMSARTPVLLFKHSLICPLSVVAREAYRAFLAERTEGDGLLYGLIEIQKARDVSNEAAVRTGVKHESPQVLLVRDGRVLWSASHWDITEESLREGLKRSGIA